MKDDYFYELTQWLKNLEDFVYKNEDSFLKYFVADDGDILMGLNGIWFGANTIKFYFILNSGQHITGTISWEEFTKWKESIKE